MFHPPSPGPVVAVDRLLLADLPHRLSFPQRLQCKIGTFWRRGVLLPLGLCALVVPGLAWSALAPQPLAFEPNQGQTDSGVAYLARGAGYVVYLTGDAAVLALKGPSGRHVLRMTLAGATRQPHITARSPLPARHNYYIGDKPSAWHPDIPTYGAVTYRGVYPGVDLVYHGRQGQLEYDFCIAPGADPAAIRLAFSGAGRMAVTAGGDLTLDVGGTPVIHHAPVAYQLIDGSRIPVTARYAVRGGKVAFQLGTYDETRPLVIDPTLNYAGYLGGSGDDEARAVAVDGDGNMYLTGSTQSTDFPIAGATIPQQALLGPQDVFIAKLDKTGKVIFATYLGDQRALDDLGTAAEKGNGIALDGQGLVYVTGATGFGPAVVGGGTSQNFPTTTNPAPYKTCSGVDTDAFVAILDTNGRLHYSSCIGGSGTDEGTGIAVNDSGTQVYIAGYEEVPQQITQWRRFPATSNGYQTDSLDAQSALTDGFFAWLDPTQAGNDALRYSTYLGGTDLDRATGVAMDSVGNAYISGWTYSTDLAPITPSTAFQAAHSTVPTGTHDADAFVVKLDPAAAAGPASLLYGTYFGGNDYDQAYGIAISGSDTVFITGATASTNFTPIFGSSGFNGGNVDAFLARLNLFAHAQNASNSDLAYFRYVGGSGDDYGYAVAVDGNGRPYITGSTTSSAFTDAGGTVGGLATALRGGTDAFVMGTDSTGATVQYSGYVGGTADDEGRGIALDAQGNTYVVGGTRSTDWKAVGASGKSTQNAGGQDAFIAVIGHNADVGVTLSGTNPAPAVLQPMTYTMYVTNNGPDTASGVTLTLKLSQAGFNPDHKPNNTPAAVTGAACTANSDNTLFTCAVGTLISGQAAKITITDTLTTASKMDADALVADNEVDGNATNDEKAWTVTASQSSQPTDPPSSGGGSPAPKSGGGALGPLALLLLLLPALGRRRG